jgi:hypothetical protein
LRVAPPPRPRREQLVEQRRMDRAGFEDTSRSYVIATVNVE